MVSPAFFHINSNGELENNIGTSGKEYVEWAHSNGYKVWPMLQNDGTGMMSVTSKIMNDYNKRQKLINEILMACIQYKIDGINLDIENMKQEDKDMYSRFIIELEPRLKEIGMTYISKQERQKSNRVKVIQLKVNMADLLQQL